MPLRLEQMRERIRAGKSVLYKNRVITKLENLPTAAQMATTDEEKQIANAGIDAQIALLQKQKVVLGEQPAAATATAEKSDEFKPLPVEETLERMKNFDFSEDVTRSLQVHQEEIKKRMDGGGSADAENDSQSDAETFESFMKLKHDELFKKAEPVAKEKGIELDPKATKAFLSRFILGMPEPTE